VSALWSFYGDQFLAIIQKKWSLSKGSYTIIFLLIAENSCRAIDRNVERMAKGNKS
jgi:hypothetical protein